MYYEMIGLVRDDTRARLYTNCDVRKLSIINSHFQHFVLNTKPSNFHLGANLFLMFFKVCGFHDRRPAFETTKVNEINNDIRLTSRDGECEPEPGSSTRFSWLPEEKRQHKSLRTFYLNLCT